MEDAAQPSEITTRRSKRARVPAKTKFGENQSQDRTSEPSDQSPSEADREGSVDEFVEPRARAKRNRTEGSSTAAKKFDQSLIEVIKGNGKLIPQVVKLWVEQYEKDPKPAMVELLMMLFEACGAKYHLREELLDETDVDDVVVALVNLARTEDYQSSKKKEFKNFKDNLVSFWDNLVIECQNGPLFDQVLFDKCVDYIIALSCTPPRVYRQVASLMGLQLVTSFITVAKMLGAQRETTQRQLNAEKKKRTEGPRVESLNKRLSTTHEKITVIEEMMRKIFTGLFVHRYRDIDQDIRMSCIQSLGLLKQLLRHQLLADDDLGDDGDSSEVHLGRMLQILREFSADPILSIYVIDDVWEYMNAMKDWKCIISMLLDENPLIELTDEDATNLIRLLCASVKKAVGERIVPATDNRKQYYNKAQKEIFEHNRRDITVAMMKNYSQLLRKFMADKQNECQGELKDFAQNKLKELEDELIAKLKTAIKEVADGDDEYSLLVNLKRLYELQLSRSVPIESLYEDMVMILKSSKSMDDEVVSFLLHNMSLHVAWCLHAIINSDTVSEESLSSLLSKRTTLFEQLEHFLYAHTEVQEEGKRANQPACRVCIILAQVWCLFKKTKFSSTKLESLGYCPDSSVLQKFWKLCEQQLNISGGTYQQDLIWTCSCNHNKMKSNSQNSPGYETEEDDVNQEYVEETNRDAVMIAAAMWLLLMWFLRPYATCWVAVLCYEFDYFTCNYAKIVKTEYLGPEIISHFVMHGTSIAEIVKNLIAVLKKKDDDVPNIFLEALRRQPSGTVLDRTNSIHLHVLRSICGQELGKYCLTFVLPTTAIWWSFPEVMTRPWQASLLKIAKIWLLAFYNIHGCCSKQTSMDILRIVKDGIDYAFVDAPKQLSFLEIAVLHFVSRLPTSDVLEISLKDVQKRTENVNTDEDPSGWRPYYTFIDSLREKYSKNDGFQDEKEGTSVRRRGRPRKRRNIQGKKLFDDHSSSEEDSISASDEDARDDEERQGEEEEEEAPLIQSIRSSAKLRSLRVSREENKGPTNPGDSGRATDAIAASRTSVNYPGPYRVRLPESEWVVLRRCKPSSQKTTKGQVESRHMVGPPRIVSIKVQPVVHLELVTELNS
ncbi:Sister-chromatid cohesion protein 3 [Vitis vinifera]|uniref:Sister-chromatid cohesion protein 3 n=1 Tax=Vitis vinifera TaxID=29760 RepID=A0A438CDD7_VITVI|nr:Sister-chromatid cohesion protein 3 [Vitis vinifera]